MLGGPGGEAEAPAESDLSCSPIVNASCGAGRTMASSRPGRAILSRTTRTDSTQRCATTPWKTWIEPSMRVVDNLSWKVSSMNTKGNGYQASERRAAPRIRLLSHAYFSAGRVEGRGVLYDLSATGARIEEATSRIKPGTKIHLTFALDEHDSSVSVSAAVVRETETGFAVHFVDPNQRVKEWVEGFIADQETEIELLDSTD